MSHSLACYHCSSIISPAELVEVNLSGINRSFCCPGCMAIAQTIHSEGLDVFYTRRVQSSEKPAAYLALNEIPEKLKPYDDPSLRNSGLRPLAIAKAIAKGRATMPTVNPAKTSFANKVLL